jgi:glutathione S-transferase
MDDTLILHHYDGSPFSEKVRLIMGFKGLAWRGVQIPVVMPKPDVVALTGGYRRTPVLQVGADIYCDTALIARVLEALQPQPTLYPHQLPYAAPLAQWADSALFWAMAPYVMQPAGAKAIFQGMPPDALQRFRDDRAAFTAGMRRTTPVDAAAQLRTAFATLAAALADGRPFLGGPLASIADFSVAHCLWWLRRAGPLAGILDPFPAVGTWLDRMLAIGHGRTAPMDSAEALAIAAAAGGGHAATAVQPGLGFEAGQAVTVAANDYGIDPVAGVLVGLSDAEVVIERTDARAGTLHVHFPRIGFQIKPQEKTA